MSGERLVYDLSGFECARAGQAQQRGPKRVGVLVRLDKEIVRGSRSRRNRCADQGAQLALENLSDQKELFVGELGGGDHASPSAVPAPAAVLFLARCCQGRRDRCQGLLPRCILGIG